MINSITSYCEEHSLTAEECVSQMRKVVHEETKLTVSAGIAPNKVRLVGPKLRIVALMLLHPTNRC